MQNKGIAWFLWALSWAGVGGLHRFYLGKPISGFLYLVTYNFLGVGLVMDALNLNDMVDAANNRISENMRLSQDPRLQLGLPRSPSLMHALIKAAARRQGVLTVTEAVMDTGRTFEEVEAELTELLKTNYVTIDNHPDSGAVIYRFHELEKKLPA